MRLRLSLRNVLSFSTNWSAQLAVGGISKQERYPSERQPTCPKVRQRSHPNARVPASSLHSDDDDEARTIVEKHTPWTCNQGQRSFTIISRLHTLHSCKVRGSGAPVLPECGFQIHVATRGCTGSGLEVAHARTMFTCGRHEWRGQQCQQTG